MTLSLERLRELHQTQQTLDGDLDEMDLDAALRELIAIRETASRAPETAEAVVDNLVLRGRFNVGHTVEWNRALTDAIAAAIRREREIAALRLAEERECVSAALEFAERYGSIDGDHHKMWVIDQMVRALTGADYAKWVKEQKEGEDGPDSYDWSEGIPP